MFRVLYSFWAHVVASLLPHKSTWADMSQRSSVLESRALAYVAGVNPAQASVKACYGVFS